MAETPMMRQYTEAKAKAPGALLFFRMGDFYELFFDDAKVAARALGLTLTSRSKEQEIPMAGVPVRSVDGYLRRLVTQGYRVAICEQMEDPAKAKGLVEREVVPLLKDVARNSKLNFDIQASGVLGLAKIGRRDAIPLLMEMARNSGDQYHKVVDQIHRGFPQGAACVPVRGLGRRDSGRLGR